MTYLLNIVQGFHGEKNYSVGKSMTLMPPQLTLNSKKEKRKIRENSNDHHLIRTEESSNHSWVGHFLKNKTNTYV